MKKQIILPDIVKQVIDDSHYYWVNGEFNPGVTTVLDEASPMAYAMRKWLLSNTQESADDILADTSAFGSKLHDAYEQLLLGNTLSLKSEYTSAKEKKHLASFYQWFKDYNPTDLQPESVVASLRYKFAGTLDLVCRINGRLTLIDFKTGSGIYYSHHLQVLAYKKAYEEMYHKRIKDLYILRTGTKHKAGYEFKKMEGKKFSSFLNVYKTYLDLHDGKIPDPPLVNVYPDEISLKMEKEQVLDNADLVENPITEIIEEKARQRGEEMDEDMRSALK